MVDTVTISVETFEYLKNVPKPIKFKGLSIIPARGNRIELYDGEEVEYCNSINRLIAVLQHYDSHGVLPITTKMREEREEEEDYADI
jgi:hypothetical protein